MVQRAVVRLFHDGDLVAELYAGESGVLPELTERERGWLRQNDRRAWGLDATRALRSLHAAVAEFPCSTALGAGGRGVDGMLRFFGSSQFHEAVRDGDRIVSAYGCWLAGRGEERLTALTALEEAGVRARRGITRGAGGLVLARRLQLLAAPSGASALHDALSRRIASRARRFDGDHVAAALAPGFDLSALPRLAAGTEDVLVEHTPEGALLVGTVSAGLAALLARAERPCAKETLAAHAEALGADPGEGGDVVDGLVGQGLLEAVA